MEPLTWLIGIGEEDHMSINLLLETCIWQ